ncbi:MAG: 3-deoxy-manno-octulosonate cytidylyltransferase [Flavobacteriales bacterium]|nr:3-deoxy-manno-octulosonate cytidylyltransferase [Flavobacteriales bacterium]
MDSLAIIPARFGSTRFPGKPLVPIAGKSLLRRVYEQVQKSNVDDILVATDDERIFDHVLDFGGNVVMTSTELENGTERLLAAFELAVEEEDEYDVIINVQGDEPAIDPQDINKILNIFREEETDIATLATKIDSAEELFNPNIVKLVASDFEEGIADALYFSRQAIPFVRDAQPEDWLKHGTFYRHVGIYGFSAESLEAIRGLSVSPLEKAEKLEQLRWLQNHFVISVALTANKPHGVDVPADVELVEKLLKSIGLP